MKEALFTNYSLLCQTPTEDDKIYYWTNIKKLILIFDEILKPFASSKILSWQHFEKLKWLKSIQSYQSSASKAPTGGCIDWNHENLEKTFTTYLNDKAFHYYIWNNQNGKPGIQIKEKSLNPKGYISHIITVIFGDRNKLIRDKNVDWYNRVTDFRFQIQHYANQFSGLGINQIIDISFRQNYLSDSERDEIVKHIFNLVHGKLLYKRIDIDYTCSFIETYEKAYFIDKENLQKWVQI